MRCCSNFSYPNWAVKASQFIWKDKNVFKIIAVAIVIFAALAFASFFTGSLWLGFGSVAVYTGTHLTLKLSKHILNVQEERT